MVDRTFNCVSIDTDTSTSDTAVVLAGGVAANPELRERLGRLIVGETADGEPLTGLNPRWSSDGSRIFVLKNLPERAGYG